jgi:hypothetical protein
VFIAVAPGASKPKVLLISPPKLLIEGEKNALVLEGCCFPCCVELPDSNGFRDRRFTFVLVISKFPVGNSRDDNPGSAMVLFRLAAEEAEKTQPELKLVALASPALAAAVGIPVIAV